jgi:hypothetical protein
VGFGLWVRLARKVQASLHIDTIASIVNTNIIVL